MAKTKRVMLSVHELIDEITGQDCIFQDHFDGLRQFPTDDEECLYFLLTREFVDSIDPDLHDKLLGPALKELMLAIDEDTKTGVVNIRKKLANVICQKSKGGLEQINKTFSRFEHIFNSDNLHSDFSLKKLPRVYTLLLDNPIWPSKWNARNTKEPIIRERKELDTQLDLARKEILYLYGNKRYAEFFGWLFLFSLFQHDIILFIHNYLPKTQYSQVVKFLSLKDRELLDITKKPLVSVREDVFWDIRRKLIDTACGHLIIMGPSLKEAFDRGHRNSIWTELERAVDSRRVSKVSVLLTDPIVFNNDYVSSEPKNDVNGTILALQENFYSLFDNRKVDLCIYFLPFLQIDHAVITEEFMLFRSNKLWNCKRKYKGAFTLHVADFYTARESEYSAQVDYIKAVFSNSTKIFPEVDVDNTDWELEDARSFHKRWREFLKRSNFRHIFLYKVYEKQIHSFVCGTWRKADGGFGLLTPGGTIRSMEDFYDAGNLLDDDTQNVLLPYLKETEKMFTEAIKKHDSNESSFCHLYPSLDLGFPNNVRRLAGGFATGMLVTWNCGTDIVPVDATVNVCTSSVFKLDRVNQEWFENNHLFYDLVDQYAWEAGEEKGYSFSFRSGNHFLTISQDKDSGEYYLVMHSSANELKHSYMGLYPVENNWYSDKIKTINGKNGRYFRYLKDEDARYFIRMAKNFQKYNEQIHQWVAERINGGAFHNQEKWMAHHYYMPTDQAIAIGTFAEPVGTEIPMFSDHGKPVYIFKIGPDNFQIDLGGKKGRVCLIPHGWGQKIDGIKDISVRDGKLVLKIDGIEHPTLISSQARILSDHKRIREFDDGDDFIKTGNGYIQGEFVKELIPLVEYSRNTIGK